MVPAPLNVAVVTVSVAIERVVPVAFPIVRVIAPAIVPLPDIVAIEKVVDAVVRVRIMLVFTVRVPAPVTVTMLHDFETETVSVPLEE